MKGSIIKRGEKTYLLRISLGRDNVTGKRLYRTETFHGTRKEADARLRELVREYEAGTLSTNSTKSLNEFLGEWIQTVRQRLRERTWRDYEGIIKTYIQPALGRYPLNRLTPMDIQRVYNDMSNRGLAASTVRRVHSILRPALKQAVKWRLISRSPAQEIDLPKSTGLKTVRAMDKEQAKAFLSACSGHRLEVMFLFALQTGVRPEELFGLFWPDVDFVQGTCKIQRAYVRPRGGKPRFEQPKTPGSIRSIHLDQRLCRELKRHKELQEQERLFAGPDWKGDHPLIFMTQNGHPICRHNLTRAVYKKLIAKAGLPHFRLRDLRHTCATLLIQSGENIKTVSERLGHKDVRLTLNIYAFALPAMQAETAKTAADLFQLDHRSITGKTETTVTKKSEDDLENTLQ